MTHPENFDDEGRDFTDEQRWLAAELHGVDETLERQAARLQQLADVDPVGAVWFADRDDWLDSRLSQRPPK